jgi:benzoyl-CoA reductase/2-hydroxyglutaryl-CoA dehydratase subunit BcrC/BadD/HgdB
MHVHLGISSIQKCIPTLQMLTYGIAPYATDEYCHFAKTTTTKCLKRFVKAIHKIFEQYCNTHCVLIFKNNLE